MFNIIEDYFYVNYLLNNFSSLPGQKKLFDVQTDDIIYKINFIEQDINEDTNTKVFFDITRKTDLYPKKINFEFINHLYNITFFKFNYDSLSLDKLYKHKYKRINTKLSDKVNLFYKEVICRNKLGHIPDLIFRLSNTLKTHYLNNFIFDFGIIENNNLYLKYLNYESKENLIDLLKEIQALFYSIGVIFIYNKEEECLYTSLDHLFSYYEFPSFNFLSKNNYKEFLKYTTKNDKKIKRINLFQDSEFIVNLDEDIKSKISLAITQNLNDNIIVNKLKELSKNKQISFYEISFIYNLLHEHMYEINNSILFKVDF